MASKKQAQNIDQRELRGWGSGKQGQGWRRGLLAPRWARAELQSSVSLGPNASLSVPA